VPKVFRMHAQGITRWRILMTRKCTVCTHKDVAKIDKALLIEGASERSVAARYGLGYTAVHRHKASGHIADKVIAKKEAADRVAGAGLAEDLEWVIEQSKEIYEEERQRKNNRVAIDALQMIAKTGEIRAKIAGQIENSNKVVINIAGDDTKL